MIENVIFDLDGTLLDTSQGIIESVQHTVKVMCFPALTYEQRLSFIGPPLRQSFISTCGCSEVEAQEATTVFRTHYQAGAVLHASEYDGMKMLCKALRDHGIKMGVATNKPQRFADALIQKFGYESYCHAVCGADEIGKLTKADLIRACMDKMGANADETVLIGDTDNDAIGAAQARVHFIAVTYGFGFKKVTDLERFPHIGCINAPSEIIDIVLKS